MKKRWIRFSVSVVVGILLVVVLIVWPSREPRYGGRSLSTWLDDVDWSGSPKDTQAKAAIRQIGTNALPFLVAMFNSYEFPDGPLKHRMIDLVRKQRLVKLHFWTMGERVLRGSGGLVIISPVAFPEIVRIFDTNGPPCVAANSIIQNGPEADEPVAEALCNEAALVRICAEDAVKKMGTNTQGVVQALVRRLGDESPRVRELAVRALAQVRQL